MIRNWVSSLCGRRQQLVILALLALSLIGLALRMYRIGTQPLWLDEAFSVWMSRHSIPEIVRLTIDIDQHPPLFHFLLHGWIAVGGTSEAWVRSFSALVGALTIPVIYGLGRTMGGTRIGLLAALALTVSPFHVQYGQEARAYALLGLFAGLSMWMVALLLTGPRTRETAAGQSRRGSLIRTGYILFTALAVYCHNTAVLLPVAVNLVVLGLLLYRRSVPARDGQLQPPSFKPWAFAQLGVLALWAPWLAGFFLQAAGVYDEFWLQPAAFSDVAAALQAFLMAHLPERIEWQWMIWIGFAAAFLLAWVKYRARLGHFTLLGGLFLLPLGGELLASQWQPVFYDRTLIWTTLPLYVLLAAGISQLRFRPYILTAVVILITLSGLSIHSYSHYYEKEPWNQVAGYVNENIQEGDILLFNAGWVQIPFDYYFERHNHKVEKFGVPATLFETGELEPRMTRADLPRLYAILEGRQRVWLIYAHNWWTDPDGLIPEAVSQGRKLVETRMYDGMQVQLFEAE